MVNVLQGWSIRLALIRSDYAHRSTFSYILTSVGETQMSFNYPPSLLTINLSQTVLFGSPVDPRIESKWTRG